MSPASLIAMIGTCWQAVRRASGDDAYERYLAHWARRHGGQGRPLDRKAFHADEVRRRWSGIKRCC